jgi:hypothetical protein
MNSNSTGKQHPKRNDWFDWWLSDEQPGPKAQQQIRHFRVKQANSYRKRNVPTPKPPQVAPAADSDGKSLVINLSIPKIKPPKFDFIKVKNGKYQLDLKLTSLRTLAVIICGVILASVAFSHLFSRSSAPASTTGSEAAQAASNSNSLPKISGETQTAAGQNLQSVLIKQRLLEVLRLHLRRQFPLRNLSSLNLLRLGLLTILPAKSIQLWTASGVRR